MKKKKGFTNQNYLVFKVLSMRSVYQKIAKNWVEKKTEIDGTIKKYTKKKLKALNVQVNDAKTTCSKKCIYYLGLTIFNLLNFDVTWKYYNIIKRIIN